MVGAHECEKVLTAKWVCNEVKDPRLFISPHQRWVWTVRCCRQMRWIWAGADEHDRAWKPNTHTHTHVVFTCFMGTVQTVSCHPTPNHQTNVWSLCCRVYQDHTLTRPNAGPKPVEVSTQNLSIYVTLHLSIAQNNKTMIINSEILFLKLECMLTNMITKHSLILTDDLIPDTHIKIHSKNYI